MTSTCIKNQQRIIRSEWLLNQPVLEVMKRLTWPMLPAIIAIIGLDLFDAYLVSDMGTEVLAALSFTIPVTSSLFALAIGLSIGTVSILTHSLGKGDHHKSKRLTTDCLIISVVIGLLITIAGLVSIEPLFHLLGVNYALIPESFHLGPRPDIMPIINDYMQLRYLGFVFMLLPILSNSIMRATGDTVFAGRLMFLWASTTAALDFILITYFGADNNLISIGQGHLFADIVFSIISIIVLTKREKLLEFELPTLSEFKLNCLSILKIGLPAMAMSLLTPLALGIITSWVAFYGREAIAAFGVISRIETLALFIPLVLSTSLPIFVGQNFAAYCFARSITTINKSLMVTFAAQLCVYLLLIAIAQPLAELFSDSETVTDWIVYLLWFLPLGYCGKGIVILVASSLNAIHRPLSAFCITFVQLFILLIPAAYLGAYAAGLQGLFTGLLIANLLIGVIAYYWLLVNFKKNQQRIESEMTANESS